MEPIIKIMDKLWPGTQFRLAALLLLVLFTGSSVVAQDLVNVTTQVIPPYDGNFNNFQNKVIVTLQNTTDRAIIVQLNGRLSSDNISVIFRPNPDPVFALAGHQVLQLTGAQLQNFFVESTVAVTGITKDQLYRGNGLPAGTYDLCFRARQEQNGVFVSMDAPSGCFSFTVQSSSGRDAVRLTTQVIPPYSTYLSDYIDENRMIVLLQNLSGTAQELRLAGSIEGNNGVALTIPESFQPSKPILLAPRQSLQLTRNDLQEYFYETTLEVTGITREEVFRGNGLPEGTYQWCLQARDFMTGEERSASSPAGCTFLDIRQFEPPLMITPACEAEVPATQPQNILFTWSIPAGVRPDQVEYILKIIELYPQDIDPNQAMQSANQPPLFEKMIHATNYLYSLADPRLELGKKYAYRVTVRTDENSRRAQRNGPLNFRNNGNSEVCTFTFGKGSTISVGGAQQETIGANQTENDGHEITHVIQQRHPVVIPLDPADVLTAAVPAAMSPDPGDPETCQSACNIPAPTNTAPREIGPGDVIHAGKFTMTVVTGNSSAGTGTVMINFLNTPVKVEWSGIQVNTDNQLFGATSKLIGVADLPALAGQPVVTGGLTNAGDIGPVAPLVDAVQQPSRRVSTFTAGNTVPTGLPFANDLGAFDMLFVGMIFTPTQATVNAITAIEMYNSTEADDFLMLGTATCLRPNGFGTDNELVLLEDKDVPLSTKASMVFHQNTTTATFSCQGIDEIELDGLLQFDRSALVPVDDQGTVILGSAQVEAAFHSTITNFNDWSVSVSGLNHPFTIPQLIGFKFDASDITLDHSSITNPSGTSNALPANYADGGTNWMGLYIGNLSVTLPTALKNGALPITFDVNHVMIDKHGFSAEIDPGTAILPEGQLGAWNFSITDFSLGIEGSSLTGSAMGGTIKLPIATNALAYSVTLVESEDENTAVDFQFSVEQGEDLDVDMWFASIALDATSTIGITRIGSNYRPSADLTGTLTVGWAEGQGPGENNNVGQFDLPALAFEHLTIADNGGGTPDVDLEMAELVNTDGLDMSLGNFTAHSTPPTLIKTGNQLGLSFAIDMELIKMTNSLNGETSFSILAQFNDGSFHYQETQLNSISVDGDIGVAHMWGDVAFYQDDPTYGNGFRGHIQLVVNALGGAGLDATLQTGRVDGFNYWYFDIMANLGTAGFNIPGTMASIYGIGGGAYGNMHRPVMEAQPVGELNSNQAYNDTPGANEDGVYFEPMQGSFGFSGAVAYGLTGAKSAFNGDLALSMEIHPTGAVDNVTLHGACYIMQNITDRESGMITGTLDAQINPRIPNASDAANAAENRPNFHFNAGMTINVADIVTGNATLDLYFSPDEWWIKLGEWQNEDEPWNDPNRAALLVDLKVIKKEFYSYFMMGSDIPGIPQMPLAVRNEFADKFGNEPHPGPRLGLLTTNNPGAVPSNPGMAFGAGSHLDTNLKFLVFYADLEMIKGFDILLKKYDNTSCGGNIGVNGWYAKGQAYAYLNFDVGVELDLWVWKGKASIFAATAAASLQAALPNPNWIKGQFAFHGEVLNGLFTFDTSFRFEFGEKCDLGTSSPFDEMPIVSDISPEDNADNVNVYIIPELAFNFPKNEFSYDQEVDGEMVTQTYKYVFKTFTLTYKDPQTNANKIINLVPYMSYRSDGLSATFYYPDMILPEHTLIHYTIYVQGWQMDPGSPKKLYDESHTGTFTSGSWPTHIEPEFLIQGNPQYRQNFFLKKEEAGFLEFSNPHGHLTNKEWWYTNVFKLGNYNPVTSGSFNFKAVFRELATGQSYETTYSMQTPKEMVFAIPNGLKNDKIYQLELVVHYTPPVSSFAYGGGGNVNQTYENVLVSGQQGAGVGSVTLNGMLQNNQGSTPGTINTGSGGQGSIVAYNSSSQSATILNNNYQALAGSTPPATGSTQFAGGPVSPDPDPPAPSATFGFASNSPGTNGTYIQRQRNELISQKKGDQGLTWSLFDDLPWYFKTSRYNTLREKLEDMKVVDVVYHTYSDNYERFNSTDVTSSKPVWGGNQSDVSIDTKVPVVLLEIQETFEIPYEIGGYTINVQGVEGVNQTVPPKVHILHSDDDWLENHYFYDPTNPYNLPDADDWAQLGFYDVEEGTYVDNYQSVGLPYPFTTLYIGNFIPGIDNNTPWEEDRYYGDSPFGNRKQYTPYEMMSGYYKPFYEFFKNSATHESIDFDGHGVTYFKNTPLSTDAIHNAKEQGQQQNGSNPSPSPGVTYTGATSLQVAVFGPTSSGTPAFPSSQQMTSTTKQHLAIIDFTEWVTMRDFYRLHAFVYERNEHEEGTFFFECSTSIDKPNPYNCFYPGIKNWINNVWFYPSRPAGTYQLKLGNTKTQVNYSYDLPEILNPGTYNSTGY